MAARDIFAGEVITDSVFSSNSCVMFKRVVRSAVRTDDAAPTY